MTMTNVSFHSHTHLLVPSSLVEKCISDFVLRILIISNWRDDGMDKYKVTRNVARFYHHHHSQVMHMNL